MDGAVGLGGHEELVLKLGSVLGATSGGLGLDGVMNVDFSGVSQMPWFAAEPQSINKKNPSDSIRRG